MSQFIFFMTMLGWVCQYPLQAQTATPKGTTAMDTAKTNIRHDFYWSGTLMRKNGKVPVVLHYQRYDSLPGRYHKQLIVGEVKYPMTGTTYAVTGHVLNQRDMSLQLYEMRPDGFVANKFFFGTNGQRIAGYLLNPGSEKLNEVITLKRGDTLIQSPDIHTKHDKIFGTYVYDSGKDGASGRLIFHENDDGTQSFKIFSKSNDGNDVVAVRGDSLHVTGTSFTYNAKAYDKTIWSIKVQFFKKFAVVTFTKPYVEGGRFAQRATVEGIFYKVDE